MPEPDTAPDVVVVGGGPGGSCAATLLARAGCRVVVLEKERFPRFHVGESLLPYNREIFDAMGVLPALEAAGFPLKRGAQFHLGNGSKGTAFVFSDGRFTRHTEAFQVERARFDDILLRHAAASGVDVREGVTVSRVEDGPDAVAVQAVDEHGETLRLQARFVVDASGRGNLTGQQDGLRVPNPKLRKIAIFGHFEGVALDDGSKGGDTVIVRLVDKWFWLIPLAAGTDGSPTKVSVGLVLDRDELAASRRDPADVFQAHVAASPPVQQRMRDARRVSDLHVTGDFSYSNRSFHGRRVVRVGDAAGFIDPIFSSGVYLAMFSASAAVEAIRAALAAGTDGREVFPRYERRIRAAFGVYSEMVENFYTTPFMELFLEPRARFDLVAGVNAVLAGELEGGWRLRWRMRLFFLLVRLQARFPLVPRLSFGPRA